MVDCDFSHGLSRGFMVVLALVSSGLSMAYGSETYGSETARMVKQNNQVFFIFFGGLYCLKLAINKGHEVTMICEG